MIDAIAQRFAGLSHRTKVIAGAALAVASIVVVVASMADGGNRENSGYRLATVDRGPVVKSISSTGTLSPVVTVLVGSQVSGQIVELPADFNSRVQAGQVIARIDPATFELRVRQAEAELAVTLANVVQRRAALDRATADLRNSDAQVAYARTRVAEAKNELQRKQSLLQSEFASQAQVDTARTGREAAVAAFNAALANVEARRAQVAMAEADILTADAQVMQREASLSNAQVDLDRTFIRSPVDGVVIERKVDIGQTVAASLQAPDLFTIAQDLRDMQVEVSVDESDIGQVKEGLKAKFNVYAFPSEEFEGSVIQVRLAPDVVQNVVTYKVIVAARNPDQRLLPGMTANVEIIAGESDGALRIPNAALRFVPEGEEPHTANAGGGPGGGGPGGDRGGGGHGSVAQGGGGPQATLQALAEQLDLIQEQQDQLSQALSGNHQRFQEFRAQGLSFPEIRLRIQALTSEALRSLLTPEQLEKYDELTGGALGTRRRVRVWVVGGDGQPEAVLLLVGISDNSHTEVIRVLEGELDEGSELIVGIDLQTKETASRRFRLGF